MIDVQRSPPDPAPAGSSDARRCDDDDDDDDGPENRYVCMWYVMAMITRIDDDNAMYPIAMVTMTMAIDMTMVIIIMTVSIIHDDHCNNDNDCNKDDGSTVA